MVMFGYMLMAYMFGVLTVIGARGIRSVATKFMILRKKENRRIDRRKFSSAIYVEMSKHNDQAAVDRVFGLKKGRI